MPHRLYIMVNTTKRCAWQTGRLIMGNWTNEGADAIVCANKRPRRPTQ
jgi:hypothetical protein